MYATPGIKANQHSATQSPLHNSSQHREITALCRLWLCAAASHDETDDRADYISLLLIFHWTGAKPDLWRSQIGSNSDSAPRSVRSLVNIASDIYLCLSVTTDNIETAHCDRHMRSRSRVGSRCTKTSEEDNNNNNHRHCPT